MAVTHGQAPAPATTKVLRVTVAYENSPRRIPATEVKEENGHLLAFIGDQKVADIPQDKIEAWSFELD